MNIRNKTTLDNEVANRIVQYIDKHFEFRKDAAEAINITQVSLYRMMSGKQKPSVKLIKLLIDHGMNYNWAKTGEGEPNDVNQIKPTEIMIKELNKLCGRERKIRVTKKAQSYELSDDEIFSTEVNKRVNRFILKHVSDVQEEAAKKLGISQATLSRMLNGQQHASLTTINKLHKYGINIEWVTTGKGSEKVGTKPNSLLKSIELSTEVSELRLVIKIFEANQNHLFKVVDAQAKRITDLEEDMRHFLKG